MCAKRKVSAKMGKASATAHPRPRDRGPRLEGRRERDPTWGRRDAGALLGTQRRHGPAAGRAHGRRLHVQLPVEVVVVAEAGAADRGREACAAGGHGARIEGAIVRGGAAAGAVERVPVQGREDNRSRGAGRHWQHRVFAARPSGQDVVDAEHAGGHPRAPRRDRGAAGRHRGKSLKVGGSTLLQRRTKPKESAGEREPRAPPRPLRPLTLLPPSPRSSVR